MCKAPSRRQTFFAQEMTDASFKKLFKTPGALNSSTVRGNLDGAEKIEQMCELRNALLVENDGVKKLRKLVQEVTNGNVEAVSALTACHFKLPSNGTFRHFFHAGCPKLFAARLMSNSSWAHICTKTMEIKSKELLHCCQRMLSKTAHYLLVNRRFVCQFCSLLSTKH